MLTSLQSSPTAARVAPFVCFVVLTALQGKLGPDSHFYLYTLKTFLGAWMVWAVRKSVPELKVAWTMPAILTGVGVFVLWVGLDGLYPSLSKLGGMLSKLYGMVFGSPSEKSSKEVATAFSWNPFQYYSQQPGLAWFYFLVRSIGVAVVVPPIEELFYRSFLYRSVVRPDFEAHPLSLFAAKGFWVTCLVFGFVHQEWLPGILCAMAYQGLVLRRGDLGEAVVAHGVTNALLAVWVYTKGAWHFW